MAWNGNRIGRKEAQGMSELIVQYIREMKLSSGFNRQRVFEAWDAVSGASRYAVGRFFRDGVLYCTISSSFVRNRLYFQRDVLLKELNAYLESEGRYIDDGAGQPVKNIVLK